MFCTLSGETLSIFNLNNPYEQIEKKFHINLFWKLRKESAGDFVGSDINGLGYSLMNSGRIAAGIEFFKINAKTYPDSAHVYDSLAEAYMNNGEMDLAIKYYRKALETVPKDTTTDKDLLERVKQGAAERIRENLFVLLLLTTEKSMCLNSFNSALYLYMPSIGI